MDNRIFVKNPKTGNNSIHGGWIINVKNIFKEHNRYYDTVTNSLFIHSVSEYSGNTSGIKERRTEVWEEYPTVFKHEYENVVLEMLEPLIDTYYKKLATNNFGNTQKNDMNQKKFYFVSDKQESWVTKLIHDAKAYYSEYSYFLIHKNKNSFFVLPSKKLVINVAIIPKMCWIFNILNY